MRRPALAVVLSLVACSSPPASVDDRPDASASPDGAAGSAGDPYAAIYAGVDPAHLDTLLADMTGSNPITVNGATARIPERYTPASKATYRAYWTAYFTALGATVREIDFPVANLVGETTGHDLEAVFPGASPDSVVAIVHYDSTGAPGKEAQNPAVDDNMTPMAIQMEAARLLAHQPLQRTLRVVATDYEEITTIEGGAAYVADLQQLAAAQGFHIVAAIDGELSGWNCWAEGLCGGTPPAPRSTFTLAASTCNGRYDSSALGSAMTAVATAYSPMTVDLECDDDTDGSELYNFWKVGVPAFYFEEYGNDNNPYFDDGGDDTMAHLDATYFHQIARVAAVFVANLAGLP